MAAIKRFEDLEIWQIARELCRFVFMLSSKGEFSKDLSLKNQTRSSSGSSMDNIAEGFGRGGKIEFIQFLSFSNGSASEVKSQLYRALDFKYISEEEFKTGYEFADKLMNKIGRFISYLNSSDIKGQKYRNRKKL